MSGGLIGLVVAGITGVWAWRTVRSLQAEVGQAQAVAARLDGQCRVLTAQLEDTQLRLGDAMQRAGAARRAKSAFLENMSHELRTPLNAIIGYAELLLEDVQTDEAMEDARRIRGAAHKLLAFVSDVLDLSKLEVEEGAVVAEPIDVRALVHEVVEQNRVHIERGGNELRVDVPQAPFFRSDRTALREALDALLDNAGKFTEDGVVTIEGEPRQRPEGVCWRLSVTDTGCGMAESEIEHLFDPLPDRCPATSSRGLGLPKARLSAQLLGGEVFVRSTAGAGSTFILEVPELPEDHRKLSVSLPPTAMDSLVGPASSRRPEQVVADAAEGSECPGCPVLVVEDDEDARRLVSRALRQEGLDVLEAGDGVAALAVLDQQQVSVVVLDLRLPLLDGFGVLEEIGRRPSLEDLPVLILTSMDLDDAARARLGSTPVFTKRELHSPTRLLEGVRTAVGA